MDARDKAAKAREIQDRLIAQIQKDNVENLSALGDLMFEQLVEKPRDITKLPEAVFVTSFLDIFSGKNQTADKQAALINWIAVAGTPYSEVSIIDGAGKELYKVPPMMDSSVIDPTKPLQQSISDFITNYKLKVNHIPSSGVRYAAEGTARFLGDMGHTEKLDDTTVRWDGIYNRYYGPENKPETTVVNKPNSTGDDLELNYD